MLEMLDCTEEALHALDICGPFSIVSHSMGGLCALTYILTHPERLKNLVLIGSISGGPAIARGRVVLGHAANQSRLLAVRFLGITTLL
jgi:pimeloyl-ACP methyl ester carboxylesterase